MPQIILNNDELLRNDRTGDVYSGKFEDREVAVKVIDETRFDEPKYAQTAFEREISTLTNSDAHPNVGRYFYSEYHADENVYYIAMEKGRCTLNEFLASPQPNLGLVEAPSKEQIFLETAAGLTHLHKLNIVHRNISSLSILMCLIDNIVVAKLSDFGMAKEVLGIATSSSLNTQLQNHTKYEAPEVAKGEPATFMSDIYSLGVVYKDIFAYDGNQVSSLYEYKKCFAHEMYEIMCDPVPALRISADTVPLNPMFWDTMKVLSFIIDISSKLKEAFMDVDEVQKGECLDMRINANNTRKQRKRLALSGWVLTPDGWCDLKTRCNKIDWLDGIDKSVADYLKSFKKGSTNESIYDGQNLFHLLLAIRNLWVHYEEKHTVPIKFFCGNSSDQFLLYWMNRFPYFLYFFVNMIMDYYDDIFGKSVVEDKFVSYLKYYSMIHRMKLMNKA